MRKAKCSFSSSAFVLDEDAWRILALYARCFRVIGVQRRFRSPPRHAKVLDRQRVRDALMKANAEHQEGTIDAGSISSNLRRALARRTLVKRSKWASIKARALVLLVDDVAAQAAFKKLTEYELQAFVFTHEENGPFIR